MGFCQCQLDFLQQGLSWSEKWFLPTTSSDFSVEIPKATTLAQARALLSGAQTLLTSATLTEIGVKGHTFSIKFPQGGYSGSSLSPSAHPDVALLALKNNATFTSAGKVFLRGIWQNAIGPGNEYNPGTFFPGYFANFVTKLRAGGWGWLGRNPSGTVQVRATVSAIVANTQGQPVVTLNGTPFATPSVSSKIVVRFSGIQGAAILNGVYPGYATDSHTFQFLKRIPFFPYSGGGQMIYNSPIFHALASLTEDSIDERRAGLPLPRTRGRARVKKVS